MTEYPEDVNLPIYYKAKCACKTWTLIKEYTTRYGERTIPRVLPCGKCGEEVKPL